MQSRHAVPAWFGVGHALEHFAKRAPANEQLLREIARGFPIFSDLLRNVELGMAKADLGIARTYSGLVKNAALRERVFSMLEDEFFRSRRMILASPANGSCWQKIECSPAPSVCATPTSIP